MSSKLRIEYDRLQQSLRDARDRTTAAKARFEDACSVEQTIERELSQVRDALDEALAIAARSTEQARPAEIITTPHDAPDPEPVEAKVMAKPSKPAKKSTSKAARVGPVPVPMGAVAATPSGSNGA